jgi:26S proteasome regulatory subunit, ATPase 3, interacting protein
MSSKREPDAQKQVFQMMHRCNRPTAKSEIAASFKGVLGGAAIQAALDALEESGKITAKVYGKSKVYLVDQRLFKEKDADGIDEKIREYREKCEALREEVKELNAEMQALDQLLSPRELEDRIAALEQRVRSNETRLEELKDGRRVVSHKDMAAASKACARTLAIHKSMKKIFANLVDALCEGMDVKKAQLYEDAGIEG